MAFGYQRAQRHRRCASSLQKRLRLRRNESPVHQRVAVRHNRGKDPDDFEANVLDVTPSYSNCLFIGITVRRRHFKILNPTITLLYLNCQWRNVR